MTSPTCPNGHPYTEQNTTYRKPRRGGGITKECRKCKALRQNRYRRRNPDAR